MGRPALEVIDGGAASGRARLAKLYSTCGGAVFSRCRYLLKNPTAAEDALHEVFARALQSESGFRGDASPLTWLLKIATHHCLNVLRADAAAWHEQYRGAQLVRGEAHGGAQALEDRDTVRTSLARFDLETQQAVIHYYLDEMTLEEIARVLERSVPTIRKRLRTFADQTGEALRQGDQHTEGP